MKMKYKRYVYGLFFCINVVAYAQGGVAFNEKNRVYVRSIAFQKIEQSQESIEAMFCCKNYVKAIIVGGATLASLVSAYQWLMYNEPNAVISSVEPANVINAQELPRNFFGGLMDRLNEIQVYDTALSLTQKIMFSAARYTVMGVMMRYAFHPCTLSWYIKHHVSYRSTASLMQEYTALVKSDSGDSNFYMHSLEALAEEMVEHCERVCAYIQYHSSYVSVRKQKHCLSIVNHIMESAVVWVEFLNNADFNSADMCDLCIRKTQQLVDTLTREIRHAKEACRA